MRYEDFSFLNFGQENNTLRSERKHNSRCYYVQVILERVIKLPMIGQKDIMA